MSLSQAPELNTGTRPASLRPKSRTSALQHGGRMVALLGVVFPLLLIGILKFTPIEIDALKPLIGGAPWLAWLYPLLGEAGASYFLGVVEITTALLFVASPWSARAGIAAGAAGALTFAVTVSLLFALPVWETGSGGFPWLNALGAFLIKDVALLGIALVVLGESLARIENDRLETRAAAAPRPN